MCVVTIEASTCGPAVLQAHVLPWVGACQCVCLSSHGNGVGCQGRV